MRKMMSIFTMVLMVLFLATSCNNSLPRLVSVGVDAKLVDLSRAVSSGTVVDTISAYRVSFSKVEIGNSEEDKFTLWENSGDSEIKDVTGAVDFGEPAQLLTGTYNYVRLTIGQILNIDGSIDDGGTVYTGSGSCVLDETRFLWGTDIENAAGEITLQGAIEITGDCGWSFLFNIDGTVTYLSGPEDAAILSVIKPVLDLDISE